MNLDKRLDAADPIETDDKYHIEEVMEYLETNGKLTYLVKWRGFPAKKDWTCDNYANFYLVECKEKLQKVHSKNPDSWRDPTFKMKN
jgi:hypothetical protein